MVGREEPPVSIAAGRHCHREGHVVAGRGVQYMSDYFIGLDLGPAREFTSMAVVEKTKMDNPAEPNERINLYAVRHLTRHPLGTSIATVADEVKAMTCRPPVADSTLVVD